MQLRPALFVSGAFAALLFLKARDVSACGGCFVPPEENTQVTGHRMLLSISQRETTLWDQITYTGDPASFAWVLPIKAPVEVGLSSDALFAFIENMTVPTVSPPVTCACAADRRTESAAAPTHDAEGADNGVEVIAQQVVGPYETVQLAATDPDALSKWLAGHGYSIPPDVVPVIDAYVNEGFDFLALKLVPGAGVDAMRPVRVTSPGASPTLPLRMVAAGTGAITSITLWTVGEGRYEAANFPSFTIDPDAIVWDWDTSSSNYASLVQAGFARTRGLGWLTQAAQPMSPYDLAPLTQLAQNSPTLSGYGDANGTGASEEALADLEKVYGTLDSGSMWITRLHGELPHAALSKDLMMGASSQTPVPHVYQAVKSIGTKPACPCGEEASSVTPAALKPSGGCGAPSNVGSDAQAGGDQEETKHQGGGGCAVRGHSADALAFVALWGAAIVARRRRARSRRRAAAALAQEPRSRI